MRKQPSSKKDIKKAYWQKHISNWPLSGLSKRKYCDREKISLASFNWWRYHGLKEKMTATGAVSFRPVVVKETANPECAKPLQLVLPNQLKCLLPADFPVDKLATLIRILGE